MSGSLGPPPPPVSAVSSAATSHAQAVVGAAAAMSGASSSSQFQRLKVEDALSYLDQVKLQFGNQPQVYNDFLDIMKEFKSQSIDTPGVISRVSNLFRGHPDLIVGFNTFLPPGFKIEVRHNEINISGPAQHEQALQKIAAQHNSTTSAMNQSSMGTQSQQTSVATTTASQTSRGGAVPPHPPTVTAGTGSHTPHQPVEFNHAISYVNKIKNRFQQHPDIYKAFLEILHTYQKEQRVLKDGGTPTCVPLTETEVYSQVSKLFQNQEDLLKEFGQFLPDATSQFSLIPPPTKKQAVSAGTKSKPARKTSQSGVSAGGGQGKKAKSSAKDALAEAGKHTNYSELALFEKIRKALRNPEVYDNFLRCLILFNEEIISRQELVHLVTPFLGKYPELFMSLKVLLGFREPGLSDQLSTATMTTVYMPKERVTADLAAEIDFNSLKRQGASYRALPKTYVQPKCSGRTQLCCEVLNDTWVSFPMWSEDSTFQGTRKTQFEEHIFRCEDERFELDIVLDTNLSTIRIFEALQKKFSRMTPDDLASFSLEDSLGGRSEVLQRKAIHRIYGDKAPDIIEGLKKSPAVALPIVLKRLKVKQEEWLEAQRSFNKLWREQLEKYYLKSLDYQGINFKALDTRSMRSKSLVCEIESVFDERQEQMVENFASSGPHLSFTFPSEQRVFADAVGLVMYYLKRASSMQRDDAVKIRSFLTQTLADFCYYDKVEVGVEDDLSPESGSDPMDVDDAPNDGVHRSSTANISGNLFPDTMAKFHMMDYHLMFTNNSVYTFFRLLHMLVERVGRIYCEAMGNICEEERSKSQREEGGEEEGETAAGGNVAINLGIKKSPDIQIDEYFPTFLNMAKNLMEGNIDSTTYEDTCREMFGVHAYVVFTIDRLVQNIVRQVWNPFYQVSLSSCNPK
jgi:paired amphipathic helix protein Sin3a